MLWNPQAVIADGNFGVRTNRFGFDIAGTSNDVVVVEACTNLLNALWVPVKTNTLAGKPVYFSDAQWPDYPRRFYRLVWP